MGNISGAVRRKCRAYQFGASMLAMALASTPAWASCTPDPTLNFSTTTCTDLDGDGLAVRSNGTIVQVTAGAEVRGGDQGPSIVGSVGNALYNFGRIILQVDGTLTDGVRIDSGVPAEFFGVSTQLDLNVSASGAITGATAVRLDPTPGNPYGTTTANVTNAGTIRSTTGAALVASDAAFTAFNIVNNQAGGVIGGIRGTVQSLTNAGLIDGGSGSAYAFDDASSLPNRIVASAHQLDNAGIIRSGGDAATLAVPAASLRIYNVGQIVNLGSGQAIDGTVLTVDNRGGTIASGGSVAIAATSSLSLVNRGSITGSIVVTPAPEPTFGTIPGSVIDTSGGGTIAGDVTLGGGADTVIADYSGSGPITGITGTVNAGAGNNIFRGMISSDATLTSLDLPTGFQSLQLDVQNGVNATLAPGVVLPGTVAIGGFGTVTNNASLSVSGPAFASLPFTFTYSAGLINNGSITSQLGDGGGYAVNLFQSGAVANTGSIVANGGGGVNLFAAGGFANSGTIDATGNALSIYSSSFSNSGRISSSGGVGIDLSQLGSATNQAGGTIEGATLGASLTGTAFDNYGTIRSSGTGAIVGSGSLYNRAGGVITGGNSGITATSFATIVNAGTINGSVDFTDFATTYVALPGSVLNGNLNLGYASTFVTDLLNDGPGSYARINGVVTGSGLNFIRYRVTQDSSAIIPDAGIFGSVGYDLSNGAALTLTSPQPVGTGLLFAGTGSVDLTADISLAGASLIQTNAAIALPGEPAAAPQVAIVSHGTLTLGPDPQGDSRSAVSLDNDASFTNGGIIRLVGGNSLSGFNSAIGGGANVVNSGTISLDGGRGVVATARLVNSGTILQAAGGAEAYGVQFVGSLINSGTISTERDAVTLDSPFLNFFGTNVENTGVIASGRGFGVTSLYSATVDNRAGGTISGAAGAISLGFGSTVLNAGTINGDVSIGANSFVPNTYIAAGGTLNGNLRLGSGNDLFVAEGGVIGVTGTIDAGGGMDTFIQRFTGSGTAQLGVTLPATFEVEGVEALGAATVITVAGPAAGVNRQVRFFGDGAIVNTADINPSTGDEFNHVTLERLDDQTASGLDFTNRARIGDGLSGIARGFANSGAIGAADVSGPAVSVQVAGERPFVFVNSGSIQASGERNFYDFGSGPAAVLLYGSFFGSDVAPQADTLTNSGTISGGLAASLNAASVTVANSGTISRDNEGSTTLSIYDYIFGSQAPAPTVTVTNSGTVTAGARGSTALLAAAEVLPYAPDGMLADVGTLRPTLSVTNSGTITADQGGKELSDDTFLYTVGAAVGLYGSSDAMISLTNASGGRISASGPASVAVAVQSDGSFVLDNAGTLVGGPGGDSSPFSPLIGNFFSYPSGYLAGAVQVVGATSIIRNSGTITGSIQLAEGADRIENRGTIDGNVFLGAGDDSFVALATARMTGTIDGGVGTNALVLDTSGSTGAAFDLSRFVNFADLALTGSGSLGLSGALLFPTIRLTGGGLVVPAGSTLSTAGPVTITGSDAAEKIVNVGAIAGQVDLAGGNDLFENRGSVGGAITLGSGDDVYAAYPGATAAGSIDGGPGTDLIELHSAGTDAAPTMFNPASYTNFERLAQSEGFTAYGGSASFAQVAVTGGRLIGLAGSTLTANSGITVASGATFGSAGTVTGNIAVAGTLAPGASPGTMTVIGNVALAAGSISLFELSPTIGDKLLVSGTLAIASGATLTLVGSRPLTPGSALDLIVAEGGLTGNFSTINQPASILGFIAQRGNRIQLLGQFALDAGFSPQLTTTISYVNGVLVGGQASTALIAAIPSLLTTTGGTNAAAFARLNPEAYASATQVAVENGLTLAQASRLGAGASSRLTPGLYTFVQGLGDWRTLDGSGTRGTSRAKIDSAGLLGGIGFGAAGASVGAFVGYLDSRQTIAALGARTNSDGVVAGVSGHLDLAGVEVAAMLAYDGGKTDTRRALPGGGTATSRYRLHGWVADGSIGYSLPLLPGWALKPQAGLTYIETRRGAADETGGSPFALDVAGRKSHATFADGTLTLRGSLGVGAIVHPWVSAGVRWQVSGRRTLASARFAGVGTSFASEGVRRPQMLGIGSAGLDVDLGSNISLFAAYKGEFGHDGKGNNVNGGIRVRF